MCNSNRASWFLFRSTSPASTQDPPIRRRGPGRPGHQESRRTVVARALQSFSLFSSAAWSAFLPILSLSLSLSLSLMSRRWTKNNNNSSLIYSALFDLCIPKKFHNKKFLLLLWWWCWRSNVLELLDAQVLTRGAYLLTPTYAHTRIPLCFLSISALFSSHQNPDHVFRQRSQLSSPCKLDWICLLNAHARWWELMRAS
jgi:hypothetical protein